MKINIIRIQVKDSGMLWISRLFDKTGAMGAIVAAMGCASCFPALGALAASLGIGFLAQFEGLFINTLLPIFTLIALSANVVSFLSHKHWVRLIAGIAGPIMVLLTLYPLWAYSWSSYLFYAGLIVMMGVAIWDIVYPPEKFCHSQLTMSRQSWRKKSFCSPQSPVLNVVIKKQKQCQQMHANGFMSVRVVLPCSSQNQVIVVYFVLTVPFRVRQFSKAQALVAQRSNNA